MDNKEFAYKGLVLNGFIMLLFTLAIFAGAICCFIKAPTNPIMPLYGILLMLLFILCTMGFIKQEPNEAKVLVFFGKYSGTFTRTGFYWVNPFLSKKSVSLRARNLNPEPIKVNDKSGNPVLIGMVLVWKLENTYKALFEIDSQSLAPVVTNSRGGVSSSLANAFENFVRVQSDAALRQVAGNYAYDNADSADELTLRSNAEEINEQLVRTLNERLSMAGIHVTEARINYLAYAPEIAAVMLRRQQADAIIAAREKIVDGAVSMVKMALDKLEDQGVVTLDQDKKAAMVSNLLVVLCGDEPAQPVVNSGNI
ncbi:MAG: SPFH domain-containing protein [Bacteroidales bacterium]|nr:SPFH domain-containing protein [Bacteroidales bacterium]MBQ1906405.1 SPFH domain-containing protein [Bacteroidales bacterium]MBQ2103921.1 SPFH domain-containing protein [Bacteroidales bacterium]MBQ2501636.1 SPFH domain-containing protein [Bacteroidales bacterium]MBQ4168405.1 SPFH domain-containing protein [Bacteroidales bacterium]